jgi:hypothetical protein
VQTPYLEQLEGIDVEIADEPSPPPEGWEAFVSTAFAGRVAGKTRAELLAELVSLRDSIVVAGAHGKTTTSGMITFCLERLGRDPAWLIGADVPQLGGNAGIGAGWLVVEGDESDRTIAALRPRVAVRRMSTSTITRRSVRELRWPSSLRNGSRVPAVVRGEELARTTGRLPLPVSTTAVTRHCARGARAAGVVATKQRPYSRVSRRNGGSSTAVRQEASTSTTTMPPSGRSRR